MSSNIFISLFHMCHCVVRTLIRNTIQNDLTFSTMMNIRSLMSSALMIFFIIIIFFYKIRIRTSARSLTRLSKCVHNSALESLTWLNFKFQTKRSACHLYSSIFFRSSSIYYCSVTILYSFESCRSSVLRLLLSSFFVMLLSLLSSLLVWCLIILSRRRGWN